MRCERASKAQDRAAAAALTVTPQLAWDMLMSVEVRRVAELLHAMLQNASDMNGGWGGEGPEGQSGLLMREGSRDLKSAFRL